MSSRSLPSRVAPRSRSVGRPGREDEGDYKRRSPLPTSPRMPPSQNPRPQGRSQVPRGRMDGARTLSSSTTSTTSSSGSSFLDRMKVRSGETSSRTSLDDDYEEPSKRAGGWAPARSRRPLAQEEERYAEEDGYEDSMPAKQEGHGYDLWGRVTAVAGNLTVNVSKAWEKGIHIADGEETPPGQESRLTKAMKAYHLDRARSPADLPAWLFDEHERGVAPQSWSTPRPVEYEERFRPEPEPRQRSGLRDIYEKAAASSARPIPGSSRVPTGQNDAAGDGGSRAANRLKAIRDAKRSALQTRSEPVLEDRDAKLSRRSEDRQPSESSGVRTPPVRMGLPAGPGRVRRQGQL